MVTSWFESGWGLLFQMLPLFHKLFLKKERLNMPPKLLAAPQFQHFFHKLMSLIFSGVLPFKIKWTPQKRYFLIYSSLLQLWVVLVLVMPCESCSLHCPLWRFMCWCLWGKNSIWGKNLVTSWGIKNVALKKPKFSKGATTPKRRHKM